MICLVCQRSDTHRYSCDTCTETTRRRLREIELYAEWLATPAMLEPTRGTTGRRKSGYGSRPPARDDVLDYRSRSEQVGPDDEDAPVWSILGTLYTVATFVRGHARDRAPRRLTLAGELRYLLGRLDWTATRPWADVVAKDVRQLHAQATAHPSPSARAPSRTVAARSIPRACATQTGPAMTGRGVNAAAIHTQAST